jgi:hypothetical protein
MDEVKLVDCLANDKLDQDALDELRSGAHWYRLFTRLNSLAALR